MGFWLRIRYDGTADWTFMAILHSSREYLAKYASQSRRCQAYAERGSGLSEYLGPSSDPPESAGDNARLYAFAQFKRGAHSAHDSRLPVQANLISQRDSGAYSGAMSAYEMRNAQTLHLISRPCQMVLVSAKQMKTAYHSVDGSISNALPGIRHGVDHTGMATSGDHDEPFVGINYYGLTFRYRIRNGASG